jgi:hypothetical protein
MKKIYLIFLFSLFLFFSCTMPSLLSTFDTPSLKSSSKDLTSFKFASSLNSSFGINNDCIGSISGTQITITVPYNTVSINSLIATFISTGLKTTVQSAAQISNLTPNNYSAPIIFTVVAADNSTKDYTILVNKALCTDKALTAFSFPSVNSTGVIDETNHLITVTVPYSTDLTSLISVFSASGQNVLVNSIFQTSGTTKNNFTTTVIYTVVAADNSSQNYSVTVNKALSTDKAITAFSFPSAGTSAVINETSHVITATVPYSADLTNLIAVFSISGQKAAVNSIIQVSGTTMNNFTSTVIYTVTAADNSTQNYSVIVTKALSPEKALTAFSFPAFSSTGVIDETNHKITVTVPYTTDLTGLTAVFSTTGQSVLVNSLIQVSGTTKNNFSSVQTYTVIAADSTYQSYLVTVLPGANPETYVISEITAASVTLYWDAPSGTAPDKYSVYYKQHFTSTWKLLKAVTTTQLLVNYTDLDNGKIYDFAVSAIYTSKETDLHTSLENTAIPATGWYIKWVF